MKRTKPNILFITIDGLRFDRLGIYGHRPDPSPFLNDFFAQGLDAVQAYSSGCPTQFVFPSIMTSTLPLDHGGYEFGILGRGPSWVEILKDAGYRTAAFSPSNWTSRYDGYHKGMDDFFELFDLPIYFYSLLLIRMGYFISRIHENRLDIDYGREAIGTYLSHLYQYLDDFCARKLEEIANGFPTYNINLHGRDFKMLADLFRRESDLFSKAAMPYIDELIEKRCGNLPYYYLALKRHNARLKPSAAYILENFKQWRNTGAGTQPFFAWLHLMDVHDGTYQSHDVVVPPDVERGDTHRAAELHNQILGLGETYSSESLYDLGLAYVDRQLKRLFDYLEHAGLRDDTLVVITADHGLPKGAPGRRLKGLDHFFEEYVHVPLCFRHPDIGPGTVDRPATHMDIGPSLLDFIGLPVPKGFAGRSLFSSRSTAGQPLIFEHMGLGPCDFRTKRIKSCVRRGCHKLVYQSEPGAAPGNGTVESLYNIESDPLEAENLKKNAASGQVLRELTVIAADRCTRIRAGQPQGLWAPADS